MFDIEQTAIPGCVLLHPAVKADERGRFVKTAHATWFAEHGLDNDIREQFYSVSHAGVLRGLHFQIPPHDHAKLVFCAAGGILDAVVDLRVGSSAYKRYALFELNADRATIAYLPPGVAHGFLATRDDSLVVYNVTAEYAPAHDRGILWSSAGIPWPPGQPIVSPRDAAFPRLEEFESPFVYRSIVHAG